MNLRTLLPFFSMLFLVSGLCAEESNQRQVRSRISDGGWNVYYGEKITEAEYLGVSAAVAASIVSENPGPVIAYMEEYITRTVATIKNQIPDMTEDAIRQMIERAITAENGTARIGNIDFKFGLATYQRWERIVYDEPRIRMVRRTRCVFGREIVYHEPCSYTERVERRVPLPNWHDPYVAFRIR